MGHPMPGVDRTTINMMEDTLCINTDYRAALIQSLRNICMVTGMDGQVPDDDLYELFLSRALCMIEAFPRVNNFQNILPKIKDSKLEVLIGADHPLLDRCMMSIMTMMVSNEVLDFLAMWIKSINKQKKAHSECVDRVVYNSEHTRCNAWSYNYDLMSTDEVISNF